jgi:hypothetical protein
MKLRYECSTCADYNSTVVTLKDGTLLEIRRGSKTGAALGTAARWSTVESWMDDLNGCGTVYDEAGKVRHTVSLTPPSLVVEMAPIFETAKSYNPAKITKNINVYLESIGSTASRSAKVSIVMTMADYLLSDDVHAFVQDPAHSKLKHTIIAKMAELCAEPSVTPEFTAKMNAVISAYQVKEAATEAIESAVAPMSKDMYCATIGTMVKNTRGVMTSPDWRKKMLSYYKEEYLAFLSREDVIVYLEKDHAERLDARAFIRWLIGTEETTDAAAAAAKKLLERIPM